MTHWTFHELVDVARLQRMANHLYAAGGIPVGILDPDGTVYVKAGWQDLCVYFHRTHPQAGERCRRSDAFINKHIDSHPQTHTLAYKCENHLWDIANPIIIDGQHVATLFVGQFYYDDETLDLEVFRRQAAELGYDEEEYMAAVRRLPVFSRQQVDEMIAYYIDLIQTLAENGLAKIHMQQANEKLAGDQKRFEGLVRMLPVGIYETDPDDNVLYINQALHTMLGLQEDQTDSLPFDIRKIILPQDASRAEADRARVVAEGGLSNLIYTIRRQDGSTFPAMLNITAVDPGKPRSGMRGVVVDLTMQMAAEKALHQSQERFEMAMEASRDGIWDWDLASGFIYFTPNYTRMLGYGVGEIPNHISAWQTLIHPDDVNDLMQMASDCINGRRDFLEKEFRMLAKSGKWLWIYSRGKVAYDSTGSAVRFVGTQVDLTEQRSALEAVQRSEKDYQQLFDTMVQGVVYHDREGLIFSANPAACRILGLTQDQILGRTSKDPLWHCIHEDGSDFPGPDHPAMISFRTGQPVQDVVMGVYNPERDAFRWIVVNSMPEFLPGETHPYRVFATITDITELHQAQMQKQANEVLFSSLFNNMTEGVALHEIIFKEGQPVNYRLLDINPQYEKTIHLERQNVIGRLATEVYGTPEAPYLAEFANPQGMQFETYFPPLDMHFHISVVRIDQDHFATIFFDVTRQKKSEESLRASEERFRRMAENIRDGLTIIENRKPVYTNLRLSEITGYEPEELKHITGIDLAVAEEKEQLRQIMLQRQADGLPLHELEFWIQRKDGSRRYILNRYSYTNDDMTNRYMVTTDLTERKMAELALRDSEMKNRALLEAIPDMMFLFSRDGRFLDYKAERGNPNLALPTDVFLGKRIDEVMPELGEQTLTRLNALFTTGQMQVYEYSLFFMGEMQEYESRLVTCGEDRSLAIVRNITERKRAEKELAHAQAMLLAALEQTSAGVMIADAPNARIKMVNRAGEIILGQPEHEGVSMDSPQAISWRCYRPDGTLYDVMALPLVKTVQNGESFHNIEMRVVRADGSECWILVNGSPIRDDDGKIIAGIIIFPDITSQKEIEAALHKLNLELEQRVAQRTAQLEISNRELEAFSYSVSHDLRTPLRSMDGFSRALLEDYGELMDETGKDYLNRIRSASQRMGKLIDDLLKLSRITRTDMRLETLNLSEMARDALRDLQMTEPERQVRFIAPDTLKAQGDASLIQIVLNNLLSNAWKFTSNHPQAVIELGCLEKGSDVIYYIRDDGAGFNMDYASKLFGAFQRLHRETDFEGTGIGLAIVQRIIYRHGGKIWAEGAEEKGATFYFTLPLHKPPV